MRWVKRTLPGSNAQAVGDSYPPSCHLETGMISSTSGASGCVVPASVLSTKPPQMAQTSDDASTLARNFLRALPFLLRGLLLTICDTVLLLSALFQLAFTWLVSALHAVWPFVVPSAGWFLFRCADIQRLAKRRRYWRLVAFRGINDICTRCQRAPLVVHVDTSSMKACVFIVYVNIRKNLAWIIAKPLNDLRCISVHQVWHETSVCQLF